MAVAGLFNEQENTEQVNCVVSSMHQTGPLYPQLPTYRCGAANRRFGPSTDMTFARGELRTLKGSNLDYEGLGRFAGGGSITSNDARHKVPYPEVFDGPGRREAAFRHCACSIVRETINDITDREVSYPGRHSTPSIASTRRSAITTPKRNALKIAFLLRSPLHASYDITGDYGSGQCGVVFSLQWLCWRFAERGLKHSKLIFRANGV
jgi:hypothetical protein